MLIGSCVKSALGVGDADDHEVGQFWVQGTKATAWRLLIERGQGPGHHAELRERLDEEQ